MTKESSLYYHFPEGTLEESLALVERATPAIQEVQSIIESTFDIPSLVPAHSFVWPREGGLVGIRDISNWAFYSPGTRFDNAPVFHDKKTTGKHRPLIYIPFYDLKYGINPPDDSSGVRLNFLSEQGSSIAEEVIHFVDDQYQWRFLGEARSILSLDEATVMVGHYFLFREFVARVQHENWWIGTSEEAQWACSRFRKDLYDRLYRENDTAVHYSIGAQIILGFVEYLMDLDVQGNGDITQIGAEFFKTRNSEKLDYLQSLYELQARKNREGFDEHVRKLKLIRRKIHW